MSVSRKVIAEVNGVEESEVRCETCAKFEPVPFIPFCKAWNERTYDSDFCSFWDKRGDEK